MLAFGTVVDRSLSGKISKIGNAAKRLPVKKKDIDLVTTNPQFLGCDKQPL